PLREVKLPGQLSQFMLGKIIYIDGIPHRPDTFGGSKMKGQAVGLGQVIQDGVERLRLFQAGQTPKEEDKPARLDKDHGSLIAIPLADTFPGSDLEKLMGALLTNE